jgi:hypothetical protein
LLKSGFAPGVGKSFQPGPRTKFGQRLNPGGLTKVGERPIQLGSERHRLEQLSDPPDRFRLASSFRPLVRDLEGPGQPITCPPVLGEVEKCFLEGGDRFDRSVVMFQTPAALEPPESPIPGLHWPTVQKCPTSIRLTGIRQGCHQCLTDPDVFRLSRQ